MINSIDELILIGDETDLPEMDLSEGSPADVLAWVFVKNLIALHGLPTEAGRISSLFGLLRDPYDLGELLEGAVNNLVPQELRPVVRTKLTHVAFAGERVPESIPDIVLIPRNRSLAENAVYSGLLPNRRSIALTRFEQRRKLFGRIRNVVVTCLIGVASWSTLAELGVVNQSPTEVVTDLITEPVEQPDPKSFFEITDLNFVQGDHDIAGFRTFLTGYWRNVSGVDYQRIQVRVNLYSEEGELLFTRVHVVSAEEVPTALNHQAVPLYLDISGVHEILKETNSFQPELIVEEATPVE